jgi:hypothetical protein
MTEDECFWEHFWECDFGGEDYIGAGYECYCRATEPVDDTPWEEVDPLGYYLYQWARAAAEAEQDRIVAELGQPEKVGKYDKLIIEDTLHAITNAWRTLHQGGCTYLLAEFCREVGATPRRGRPPNILLDAAIRELNRDPCQRNSKRAIGDIADKHKVADSTVRARQSELDAEDKNSREEAERRAQEILWS